MFELPKGAFEVITKSINPSLIKEREGGGKKMLSYLSGHTVIDMLNKAFNYKWSWEVEKEWIQESIPYFNTYSKSDVKETYNGRQGIWEVQGPVAHVRGKLTVYFEDTTNNSILEIVKTGYGSKSILGKQNDQESIFKAAATDALKKAASTLGVGLALYRDEEEQMLFLEDNGLNPWNAEAKELYKKELEYINNVMETYGLDLESMDSLTAEFSNGSIISFSDIMPEDIVNFVKYLQNRINAAHPEELEGAE